MSTNQLDLISSASSPTEPGKNFIIYRSSAGSGKTFALVKEYLELVLRDPNDYKHILAITFTNEATREMKSRIIEDLEKIASGKTTPMRKEIEKDFNKLGIRMEIEKRAIRALKNILHNYSRFEVSTIDHFFTRVVRSLSWELKVPMRFEIDVDNDKALESAIEKLYAVVNEDQAVKSWLEAFAFNRLENDKGWKIDYNIHELGMELFQERFQEGFSNTEIQLDDLKKLASQLNHTINSYRKSIRSLAVQAMELINQSGLELKDFKGGANGVASNFRKPINNDFNLTDTFWKVARGEDNWYTQQSPKIEEIKELTSRGLDKIAGEMLDVYKQHYMNYVSAEQLMKNIYSYGLLDILHNKLKEYRDEQNLMLLSDTNFLIHEVINDNDAPFLFEKLGSKYKHILIDEFQDTSNFQWKNLLPLVLNAVSSEHRVWIAGDVKQSIYRWRGGNMRLLIEGVHDDLQLFKDGILEIPLVENRRSASNIVEFNNQFFTQAYKLVSMNDDLPDNRDLISKTYKDVIQTPKGSTGGYVEVKFFERKDEDGRAWTEAAMNETNETIKKCLEQGYQFQDIMILVDKNSQANSISEVLSRAGIPVITESSLLVTNNRKIRFLISILEWFHQPDNCLAKTNILFHYSSLTNALVDLHEVFSNVDVQFEKMMPTDFMKLYPEIARKPIYEMVEELVLLFELHLVVDSFLQRFQDICLEQSRKGRNNLEGFLEWWEEKLKQARIGRGSTDLSIKVPTNSKAVKVMTIHKAKGLESPVIIIPFANSNLKPKAGSMFWTSQLEDPYKEYGLLPLVLNKKLTESHFDEAFRQEQLEGMIERLNVTYVSFTRPKERLYIFSERFKPGKSSEISTLNKLLYYAFDEHSFGMQKYWDAQEWELKIGEEKMLVDLKDKGTLPLGIEKYPVNLYDGKVTIRADSKRFFMLFDNEKAIKIKRGVQAHTVLERLKTRKDVDFVLNQTIAEGIIENKDREDIKKRISTLFEDPLFNSWFDEDRETIAEREIISNGKIYKPDRVVIKDNNAIVIDYKSESREKIHHHQVNEYGKLLETMGYGNVRKYLVYVEDFKIEEVN